MSNLAKVHRKLTSNERNHGMWARQAVIDMVTKDTPVHLTERDAYCCFGMSKMTVKDESRRGQWQYNVMRLPEFYEFLGRVASCKYSDVEDMTLSTKIENLLDLILPHFKLERVAIGDGDGYSESSADSVDIDAVDWRRTLIKDFYENDDESEDILDSSADEDGDALSESSDLSNNSEER